MDEDLFELQAEFYNDFIWTREFEKTTAKDYEEFEKIIEARKWDGPDDIPY